jgi:hypothetical protein
MSMGAVYVNPFSLCCQATSDSILGQIYRVSGHSAAASRRQD